MMPDSTEHSIAGLLSRSVAHFNAGRPGEAEPLLAKVLAAQPDLPQAVMLMGVLRLEQGRPEEAENFLSRALAASPHQPMTLFHLGHARRGRGDLAGAVTAWRAAMTARPQFGEAALALGTALNELERNEEAEIVLAAAVRWPGDSAGEIENALGTAKLAQGRAAQALPHFENALALSPALVAAEKNRATALEHLQLPDRAAASYRRVLSREPLDLRTHLLLSELLHRAGKEKDMLRSYDEAAQAQPLSPLPPAAKGDALLQLQRPSEALELYSRALRLTPDHVPAHIGRARALTALGEPGAAIAAFEAAQKIRPGDADIQTAFAACLLGQKDAAKALALAEAAAAASPTSQAALAMLTLCYRANQDSREDALGGYDHFIQVFDLEPPPGYSDMAAFNRDLAAHLDEAHRGAQQFYSQTLRGGTRSFDEFFARRHALRDGLKRRIQETLGRYIAGLAGDPAHPFLARRARAFGMSGSWSSRMRDGGFHLNHIHAGWISSVYYVDVPDVVQDETAKQGWLKFGEPSAELGFAGSIRRMVQPKPGRLVLFPSYIWHGTVPFHSPQARTTIAFDVIPHL